MASAVTANFFTRFGVPLALGRFFTTEEAQPGARIRVVIVSHSLWQQVMPTRTSSTGKFRSAASRSPSSVWLPPGFTGRASPDRTCGFRLECMGLSRCA